MLSYIPKSLKFAIIFGGDPLEGVVNLLGMKPQRLAKNERLLSLFARLWL